MKIKYIILIFLNIYNIKKLEDFKIYWNRNWKRIFSWILDYRICIVSRLIINPLRPSYGNALRADEDRRQKEQPI